jgi:hypothetical protein
MLPYENQIRPRTCATINLVRGAETHQVAQFLARVLGTCLVSLGHAEPQRKRRLTIGSLPRPRSTILGTQLRVRIGTPCTEA